MDVKQYLPVETEIVVLSNGAHKWHTTKSMIPIVDPKPQMCPVREIESVTMMYKGYQIWFMESQALVELTEEVENGARCMKLVKLEYDIPTRVMARGELVHPSTYLWSRGVRTSGSMWILPEGNVPKMRLRELTRTGCTWHITKIDVSDAANHMQRAISALQTERLEAFASAERCRIAADERRDNGEGDINAKIKKHAADLKRIEKELERKLKNVEEGAKALNIPMHWVEGTSLRTIIRGTVVNPTRKEWDNKVEVAANAVETLRKLNTTDSNAMADALERDEVDPKIVADYLQDNDKDVFSLRDVYGDE